MRGSDFDRNRWLIGWFILIATTNSALFGLNQAFLSELSCLFRVVFQSLRRLIR